MRTPGQWAAALEGRSGAALPGHDALLSRSGLPRPDISSIRARVPGPRESAVLILIYPKNGEAHTVLIQRPTYDGVHSGQMAFPGGHSEPTDTDLRMTALREFQEETGASVPAPLLTRELTQVYIPPSDALVTPVLVITESPMEFQPDAREVAQLFEVPLAEVLQEGILKETELFIQMLNRTARVPYWDVQGQVVWGATALMIGELRELLFSAR